MYRQHIRPIGGFGLKEYIDQKNYHSKKTAE